MSNTPVIENLKKLLADSYLLYLKTHNYHWNVEGPHFKLLHEMFEEHYTDLAAAIDEIAERIRMLGEKAPGTWQAYAKIGDIKNGDEDASAETMVKELHGDHITLIETLKKTLEAAQSAGDEVTVGLATDRMTVHEKTAWMLKSSF